LFKANFSDTL